MRQLALFLLVTWCFLALSKSAFAQPESDAKPKIDTDADLKEFVQKNSDIAGLNLSHSQVTDAGLKELSTLKKLTALRLRGLKITDAGLKSLAGLENLIELDLSLTGISDAGLKELHGLKNLFRLDLSRTQVTAAGVKELIEKVKVKSLDLTWTQITEAQQEEFEAAKGVALRQKVRLIQDGGGNKASEAAVAKGLIWLAKQQKGDGSWAGDGSMKTVVGATGMALLPFLSASYTHEGGPMFNSKESTLYVKRVADGLEYLLKLQKPAGDFGTQSMYEHAIATMALCDVYARTQDPKLREPAQKAVDFIVNAQHSAGGWRYAPGQAGDTSVTGWQVQALKIGHMAGLTIPKETMQNVMPFLDSVAGGQAQIGSTYGYTDKNGSPSMTAVGLLCRQYLGWDQKNPALIAGVGELKKLSPPEQGKQGALDIYYYYYASQVVHNSGGPDWHTFWNPRMRDWLIMLQVKGEFATSGSWEPDQSVTGSAGGRLFTSCMAILTLEVYYRYPPQYKNPAPMKP
jgi:hypothetical protein